MESLGQKEQVWADHWSGTSIETEIRMWDYYGLRPWILKYTPRYGKVLEAGCGLGKFNFYLSHFGIETIGMDFSKKTIDFLNRWQKQNNYQVPFVVGDIKKLPYDNNSFSGYLAFGVMEHFIEGPQVPLKEAYRVLRSGGVAIITTPSNSWNVMRGRSKKKVKDSIKKVIGKKVTVTPFFQYYYSPPKLRKLVEEKGLMVTANGYWADHFDFGSSFLTRIPALIGSRRAADIVVNVLLPFAFAWSKIGSQPEIWRKAFDLYCHYPSLAVNAVEKHMRNQLGVGSSLISSAQRQQGLIHIYNTLCTQGGCDRCLLGV